MLALVVLVAMLTSAPSAASAVLVPPAEGVRASSNGVVALCNGAAPHLETGLYNFNIKAGTASCVGEGVLGGGVLQPYVTQGFLPFVGRLVNEGRTETGWYVMACTVAGQANFGCWFQVQGQFLPGQTVTVTGTLVPWGSAFGQPLPGAGMWEVGLQQV